MGTRDPRAAPRPAGLVPYPCFLLFIGCHQVVAFDPVPFERATSSLLVAEDPQGELQLHLDTVPLGRDPSFILGPEDPIFAFGYGCGLERLGLAGGTEEPILLEALPRPPEAWVWDEAWRPTLVEDSPAAIQALFSAPGVPESCSSFVNELVIEATVQSELPTMDPDFNSPVVGAVSDLEGGAWVTQSILQGTDEGTVRVGGRLLRAGADARFTIQDLGVPTAAIAVRGKGEIVIVGENGLYAGSPSNLALIARLGALESAALTRLAVSPAGQRFEAFILALQQYPSTGTSTASLSLAIVGEEGVPEFRTAEADVNFGNRLRIPQVVWTGPGQGWAIGLEDGAVITHIRDRSIMPVEIHPAASIPRALRAHPEVGVIVTDIQGQTFVRPPEHPENTPWIRPEGLLDAVGPLLGTTIDGFRTLAMFRRGAVEEGGGLSLAFLREAAPACATLPLDVRPSFLSGLVLQSEFVTAVEVSPGRFWAIRTETGSLLVDRFTPKGRVGSCSTPR